MLGRKTEELKNSQLRLWLKCRGSLGKGLKTKVYDYIRTGKDKNIVDLDPDKIYSRIKERLSTFTDVSEGDAVSVIEAINTNRGGTSRCTGSDARKRKLFTFACNE